MARNIQTQTLQGQELVKANYRLDLKASELDQLYRIYKDNGSNTESLFDALAAAYYTGLAVGHRH